MKNLPSVALGLAFGLLLSAALGFIAEAGAGPFGLFPRLSGGCAGGQCAAQATVAPQKPARKPVTVPSAKPIDEATKARIRAYLKGGL